jgi:predicted RecA/RadA family phage recombinase
MTLPAARQIADYGQNQFSLPAPRGSRLVWESGDIVQIGLLAYVLPAIMNGVTGDVVTGVHTGIFEATCGTAVTASAGADAYFDEANRTVVTAPGTGIIFLGQFVKAKTAGQLVATVFLNSDNSKSGDLVQTLRTRVTLAQLNAGLTLLPAVAGYKYRLIDVTLIAIGGAATAATAVRITGVQSASTVALISAAVAALTQSTVVKPNTANVTVLADGASFNQNDAAGAIAIDKTGSAMTTLTHVDVILTYELAA